ncbi:MAG: TonB-dependent receptor plug domain-containing protein, partial [Acidobacteria bacterium]|nr:TonB-dependent receptor plug domain-containing protein [Acidobacteriota bacterium]
MLDPSGKPISGAVAVLTPAAGTSGYRTESSAAGEFSLQIPAGPYLLELSAPGFRPAHELVSLNAGAAVNLRFTLDLAGVNTALTVAEPTEYGVQTIQSATRTPTPLRDVPQAITVVTHEQVRDQLMMSIGDVVRYVPGITSHQGENNRDQLVIRGNSTSADFFVNGIRDDVQYYRDLYNLERVDALKGPNALVFGRGGGGGVVNRVTKEAGFGRFGEIQLQGGSYGNKRAMADWNQDFGQRIAARLNGMYENSGSFRDYANLERFAVNPTASLRATENTRIVLSYEHLWDGRKADRGVPSYQGLPVTVPIGTFYGNPSDSSVHARVNLGTVLLEHQRARWSIRNRTQIAAYDRGYRNYVPGAVNPAATAVLLSAYDNAIGRVNFFNQSDLSRTAFTGGVRHTILGGAELGRQSTDNFRNTGYFNNSATSISLPYDQTVTSIPTTFRQSATDA